MVATHVLDERDPDGSLTAAQWLAGGRASALFAVLAGLSLTLLARRSSRGSLAVRAALIAALGLALGELETGIAVILTYYGVLFLLALPFVRLRARWLLFLAGAWIVVGPVVAQLVRPHLPERDWTSPAFTRLDDPGQLLSELLFTGYYPAFSWLAYALLGLALGRLDLRSARLQAGMVVGGLGAAVVVTALSRWLTTRDAIASRLLAGEPPGRMIESLLDEIARGMFGQTPVDGSWAWLLVVAPHSTTPFDLAQTMATSVLVIGACLGLVRVAGWLWGERGERTSAVLFGAGTMTLTLYTLHVVMRTEAVWPAEEPETFRTHVLVLMAVGAVVVALGWRGPLELAVSRVQGWFRPGSRSPRSR